MYRVASCMGRRAAGPFAAALVSSVAVSSCEQDKYDNLPDEDEPTHCSICKVNRQGPCRPLWRKFEYCMKDNMKDDDEGGDKKAQDDISKAATSVGNACDKYTMDWIDCIRPYGNLYLLLANEETQKEWIDPLEIDLIENLKVMPLAWKDPDVDWSDLWSYADEKGLHLDDFGATRIDWKAYLSGYFGQRDLDDYVSGRDVKCREVDVILGDSLAVKPIYDAETFEGDPDLVEIRARVNLQEHDGLVVDVCYARDQAGRVLGMEQFASKPEEGVKEGVLRISVQPGVTNCVKLYKLYRGDNGEVRFYASKPKFLVEAAFEAGLD